MCWIPAGYTNFAMRSKKFFLPQIIIYIHEKDIEANHLKIYTVKGIGIRSSELKLLLTWSQNLQWKENDFVSRYMYDCIHTIKNFLFIYSYLYFIIPVRTYFYFVGDMMIQSFRRILKFKHLILMCWVPAGYTNFAMRSKKIFFCRKS